MTTTPKKANSVQKPSKVPPVVSKGVRGRALTPAQKSDSSQGIRRFLAPTKSRESPALSLVSNDESAENAVPKLKKKGQVLGQTAEPPVARKAFSEMNSANETPVSRKKQTLTSVLHFQSTPEEAHADPKRQSSETAMEPSPGSSTEKAKDTSDVNTRASRLRPVDSGYGENAEISKHTGHQNSGNGKSVIPLTEESPKHKGEEAATVTRTASRPSAEVIALKAQSNDESSVEASLGRLQGRGMNDERPPYKRSFSFANIATSPPKHPSGSRQHKRPRTTHWRGLDCVTRLTEQPTSRKGYQNLIINSNPEKETVDSNSLQECIHTVPKTPESASKPRLERSVSLPSFTSSPIRQGKRLPSKGKKGLHALNLELDSDNFKENIAPSWNLQPSTSVRSSHDHHAGMNTPGRRTRVTTRAVAASPSEIVNKTSEKRGAHLNLGSHKEKVATPASFAPEAPMIGERTLKLDKDNERVVNKKLPEDRFKFHRDDDDLLYSAALNAVLAGCDSQAPEQAHSEYVAIPQETIPVPAISQQDNEVPKKRYLRFLVLEVSWSEYGYATGGRSPEKVLRLFDEAAANERYLHLREDWWQTDVNVGDYIHVIGEFDPVLNRCIADNKKTLIILHPDCLVSATHLSESFQCLRKSILQDRVRSFGEMTPPLVYGKLLHCLLQNSLREDDFSASTIKKQIETLVVDSIEDLYAIGETEAMAMTHMLEFVPVLQQWAERFVGQMPKSEAVVQHHRNQTNQKTTVCISKVLDIEENIWSPMYGFKGMIDATVQLKVRQGFGRIQTLAAPLELKTGKNSTLVSHRAQTTLYTLMMSDRYDVDVSMGILYYMRAGDMVQVPSISDEIRGLIIARNSMACYLNVRTKLPPMIQNLNACQRCYALDRCLIYHKAVENGTPETSALGSLFDKKTGHLKSAHLEFFEKWERLITMEEGDLYRLRKEIWTLLGTEREKMRRCFSRLQIIPQKATQTFAPSGAAPLQYRFARATDGSSSAAAHSFLNSHITVGDPIVISTEAGHIALSMGFVTEIQPNVVTVVVERTIRGSPKRVDNFDEKSNQGFVGIMDTPGTSGQYRDTDQDPDGVDKTVYRLDKDELTNGMGLVRANLISIFTEDGDEKRRRLIVDLETPTFHYEVDSPVEPDPSLNTDQQRAVEMVMAAQDYGLILGMPGTGKTTTIAYIIQSLVKRGKSVLLTSYTHTAVDNVLLKLREEGFDFLRLGNVQKIHPAIGSYTLSAAGITTVAGLEKFYSSKAVVATTCLGINHVVFNKRQFDYCIVDEASQLTLPVCLGPLRFAKTFILVGDHYQLPPLVRNPEAKEMGLTASLFKILSEAHPEAVVYLEHQYRMNEDIMLLSNSLIYNHRLRCGTSAVAQSMLELPHLEDGMEHMHAARGMSLCLAYKQGAKLSSCWIRQLLEPSRRVIFVNTDEVPAPDSRPGDLVQNDAEATLVHQCVEAFLACGIDETDIGVISPYRSQLKIIGHSLKRRPLVAVHTVDKFQGSDKNCVLVSLVRSNANQNVGDLLRDWRRINVAFTRAKKKLVIFGSKSTLRGTALFGEFLQIVDEKNWDLQLPAGAHTMHSVPVDEPGPSPARRTPRVVSPKRPDANLRAIQARAKQFAMSHKGAGILTNILGEWAV